MSEHIASDELPVIGVVTCHAQAVRALRRAMNGLGPGRRDRDPERRATATRPSPIPTTPTGRSRRAPFGAAIDLNPATNDEGDPPDQPRKLVTAMGRAGFGWGGVDAYPAGRAVPVEPRGRAGDGLSGIGTNARGAGIKRLPAQAPGAGTTGPGSWGMPPAA